MQPFLVAAENLVDFVLAVVLDKLVIIDEMQASYVFLANWDHLNNISLAQIVVAYIFISACQQEDVARLVECQGCDSLLQVCHSGQNGKAMMNLLQVQNENLLAAAHVQLFQCRVGEHENVILFFEYQLMCYNMGN